MTILVTGICGFVGSTVALELARRMEGANLLGLDNLSRPGSELNRQALQRHGVGFFHADIRNPSDLEGLPKADWVIDAAANPSVLAGVQGPTSSRQLMEHNLAGTLNVLEYCKRHRAGLVMLSTSRVYSLTRLCALPLEVEAGAFVPRFTQATEAGLSVRGVAENFSSQPPLSLYGSAKLASEWLALEYGLAFDFPVHVNRCGVLAGPGQFGKADQGIFSFWIHSWCRRRPLKYIGFGGTGHQVRDCLHPRDLAGLLTEQLRAPEKAGSILNISGGVANSMSLARLSEWCAHRFGQHTVIAEPSVRPFDVPWLVLDSSAAAERWGWQPSIPLSEVFEEIAHHAEEHPEWLELSHAT